MADTTIETHEPAVEFAELQPLTLTIIAHPRLERLGQQCALHGHGPFSISRAEPDFGDPGSATRQSIDDPHVSRKPVEILVEYGGATISSQSSKAKLDGVTLGSVPKTVLTDDLVRGVILTLSNYVAVLIRRVEPAKVLSERGMVGPSPELGFVRERIRRLARGKQPVLINGPTGTGKELAAQAIHAESPRASGPLVSVNLAAIPPSTAASQLFGHVRGAFTGAKANSSGLFGAAEGGTLFLDELGEAPTELQPLLLRALESGEVQIVGGGTRHVDVRVVAATDANLDEAVEAGRLRSALYHRLAGSTIMLSPLRQRREDVAAQLRHFVLEQLRELGREDKLQDGKWLRPKLQLALVTHTWPGNTRQLRRTVEAVILDSLELAEARAPSSLRLDLGGARTSSAPSSPALETNPSSISRTGERSEADELGQALAAHGYRLKPTADALGIAVNTLKSMMKRHGYRRARELSAEDITTARAAVGDHIEALSAELRVSVHALRLRIGELGL